MDHWVAPVNLETHRITSRSISARSYSGSDACALMTRSSEPVAESRFTRNISRKIRLTRFRATALPSFRVTVNPTRQWPSWFSRPKTVTALPRTRRPWSYTVVNWRRDVSRSVRGKQNWAVRSGRETLPPFSATTGNDNTPTLRTHADAEPMRLRTLSVVRLKRPFHCVFRMVIERKAVS